MNTKVCVLLASLLTLFVWVLHLPEWGVFNSDTKGFLTFSPSKHQVQIQQMQKDVDAMSKKISIMEKNQKELIASTEKRITSTMRHLEDRLNVQLTKVDGNNVENMSDESVMVDGDENEGAIEQTVVSNLDEHIYSGTNDKEWGKTLEEKINNSIEENPEHNTSLLDVHCETSLCKVEIEHDKTDNKIIFMSNLSKIDAFNDKEVFYKTSVDEKGKEITALYVAREGYQLPEF